MLFILIVYGWHTGKVIYTDDFSRIHDNSSLDTSYFCNLMLDNKSDGFYRPLNHLTFGLTYYLFGLDARAYGYFNLAILMITCLVMYRVIERITGSVVFASLTVFGWLLNFKIVSAQLLWAVGRCDGMYTLFILVAMLLSLKAIDSSQCYMYLSLSALSAFLAMLAKESAVMGPVLVATVFLCASIRRHHFRLKPTVFLAICMAVAMTLYLSLRAYSGAMKPDNAPSYYRLHVSYAVVLDHIRFYAERSLNLSGLIVVAVMAAFMAGRGQFRPRHIQTGWDRTAKTIIAGTFLFLVAAAPILALPGWSDLYGYFPSMFIVVTMVAVLSLSRIWPARRSALSALLISMVALSVIIAPTVLAKCRRQVQENRYIYDSCLSVKAQLNREDIPRCVLLRKPAEWSAAGLSEPEFSYFCMGVGLLLKKPILVVAYEDRLKHGILNTNDCVFVFVPGMAENPIVSSQLPHGIWQRISASDLYRD